VKGHMKSILSKLNANDRTHAVTIAMSAAFSTAKIQDQLPQVEWSFRRGRHVAALEAFTFLSRRTKRSWETSKLAPKYASVISWASACRQSRSHHENIHIVMLYP